MPNSEESFWNKQFELIKNHPGQFAIKVFFPLLLIGFGGGFTYYEISDYKTVELENVKEERDSLKQENEELKAKYDLNNNLVYKTSSPYKVNQSITILQGKVTILVETIYSGDVKFEFSYEGRSNLDIDERWKEGTKTQRVPFDFEGESYFIVLDDINAESEEVSFSVYHKE